MTMPAERLLRNPLAAAARYGEIRAAPERTAEIVIELGDGRTLGGIRVEEAIAFGQRVESFAVDVRQWGGWFEAGRGTTIGAQRILCLAPCHGEAVRLRILASQAPPVLSRICVYAGSDR